MQPLIRDYDPLEIRQLANSVRRFAEDSLLNTQEPEFRREDFSSLAKLGLSGMAIGEDFGGIECGPLEIAAVAFELSRMQLGPATYLSVHSMVSGLIYRWSDHEQTADLLSSLASGEKLAAFCLTEAQAGSDASNLQTRAVRDGGGYILNGEKIYITSAGVADVYLVFAKTSDDPKAGITAFVVEKDNPGISFGKSEKKMGCRGAPIASVTFENCRVDESARINEEGNGYRIALSGLNGGRINIAASACGLAYRSLELAAAHAAERKQFGQAIAQFQGIQFMLADMSIKLEASLLLTREAAHQLVRDSKDRTPASMAKCFATDAAMAITTDGVQVLGGAGYLEEYQVERLMRDAKMLQIVEGTNQIQRVLIARAVLEQAG